MTMVLTQHHRNTQPPPQGQQQHFYPLPPQQVPQHGQIVVQQDPGTATALRQMAQLHQQHFKTSQTQTKALVNIASASSFTSTVGCIPIYDRKDKDACTEWLQRCKEASYYTGYNFRLALLQRSSQDVAKIIRSLDEELSHDKLIEEIMCAFLGIPSTAAVIDELSCIYQQPGQNCSAQACGEYDHWRKDCPYDCHCDNCDSDSHATHMCRAPPKPSPTPSSQPVICIYCGGTEHKSMDCRDRPRDNREEGRVPSPASSGYSRDGQRKLTTAYSASAQKPNIRSRGGNKPQRPEMAKQHQQQPQRPTQGNTNNNNNFPYRDYRYSEQPRQTRFNERQNQTYSPYHFTPSPALSAGSDLLSQSIMRLVETQSRSLEIFAAPTKISNRCVPRTN